MKFEAISTDQAPAAIGPYSQGIQVGELVYTSGQIPIDIETGQLEIEDIKRATSLCLKNVESILKAAGSDLDHVIKTMIYITDMDDFGLVNESYGEYFPDLKPARSCVEVSKLPKGARVEIEAIALVNRV